MDTKRLLELYGSGERDFHGIAIDKADLSGQILKKAILDRAKLYFADMAGVNLRAASLKVASLNYANLSNANLRGANLQGADLRRANLSGANFKGADLRRTYLGQANLRGANLENANLSEADIWDVDLTGANLFETKLKKVHFRNACLFQGANVEKARLGEAWGLSEAEKQDLIARGAIIESLKVTILSDAEIIKMWLSEQRIDAIREYRRSHNVGLHEAFDTLQKLATNHQ